MTTPTEGTGSTPGLLILGGTTEGYALAQALAPTLQGGESGVREKSLSWAATSSLAGRTANPRRPAGACRVGGFGGPAGLEAWMRENGTRAVIDATHPFAARMGWNAAQACAAAGVPLLRLERPPWCPGPDDRWRAVESWEEAAAAVGRSARRVLMAVGRQELAPFAALDAVWFLIRSVDAPDPLPPFAQAEILLARGPFTLDGERALLDQRQIDTIVCKNSGGSATDAKLAAARALGVQVIMKARPPRPDTPTAATVEEALTWLKTVHPGDRDR